MYQPGGDQMYVLLFLKKHPKPPGKIFLSQNMFQEANKEHKNWAWIQTSKCLQPRKYLHNM